MRFKFPDITAFKCAIDKTGLMIGASDSWAGMHGIFNEYGKIKWTNLRSRVLSYDTVRCYWLCERMWCLHLLEWMQIQIIHTWPVTYSCWNYSIPLKERTLLFMWDKIDVIVKPNKLKRLLKLLHKKGPNASVERVAFLASLWTVERQIYWHLLSKQNNINCLERRSLEVLHYTLITYLLSNTYWIPSQIIIIQSSKKTWSRFISNSSRQFLNLLAPEFYI
jgi:hypothetical protein